VVQITHVWIARCFSSGVHGVGSIFLQRNLGDALVFFVSATTDVGHGWGDSIQWRTFEQAKIESKEQNKPIMVILHKSWCGACKRLKPLVAGSKTLADISSKFVMVNAEDEEEPHSNGAFAVDGSYIPRVYFVAPPSGEETESNVIREIFNEKGNPQYKYYYTDDNSLVIAMQKMVDYMNKKKDEL